MTTCNPTQHLNYTTTARNETAVRSRPPHDATGPLGGRPLVAGLPGADAGLVAFGIGENPERRPLPRRVDDRPVSFIDIAEHYPVSIPEGNEFDGP